MRQQRHYGHLNRNSPKRPILGAAISKPRWAGVGWLTLDGRPSRCMRCCASSQDGGSGVSCVQCTTAASSHHSASLLMTRRCGSPSMKARMVLSSIQIVRVQNVRRASAKSTTETLPVAALACSADRSACMANAGMSHSLLIRRRVTETNMAASSSRMTSGKFEIAAVCALCDHVISSAQLERHGAMLGVDSTGPRKFQAARSRRTRRSPSL